MDSAVKGQQGQGSEGGDGGAARGERGPRGTKGKRPGLVWGGVPPQGAHVRAACAQRPREGGARAVPATDGAGACLRDMGSCPPSQARWAGPAGR